MDTCEYATNTAQMQRCFCSSFSAFSPTFGRWLYSNPLALSQCTRQNKFFSEGKGRSQFNFTYTRIIYIYIYIQKIKYKFEPLLRIKLNLFDKIGYSKRQNKISSDVGMCKLGRQIGGFIRLTEFGPTTENGKSLALLQFPNRTSSLLLSTVWPLYFS